MKARDITDFEAIGVKVASPEKIHDWSYGEVTRPETINYRTQRSERGGLFDERIFGPEKDYECYCGKYRRIRYKNIVCEKCGVEVTRSIVRRERMGHIDLASPVTHIWFLRGIPSKMGTLLGLSVGDLERVVYFAGYIVTKVDENERQTILKELDREYKNALKSIKVAKDKENAKEQFQAVKKELNEIKEGIVLDEATYQRYSLKFGTLFEAEIGAEAIYNILKNIDLDKLLKDTEAHFETAGATERPRVQKRLNLIKSMRRAGVRPEWMCLTTIPVLPPALRPMVALDGGRHATSDINDLYRRVINRNNRLKKLKDLNAPDVILRNEKRILQEAVDALIDNSLRKGGTEAMSQAQRRPLKSMADMLKGKQGRFRQNLLGKRVDYSGRSVIVVGPHLKLDQCGLPKHMALELFRPFVISKLLEQELAFNIRGANRLIDEGIPEVWAILEEVIKGKYVLLNRAPTLHRLGIQAFQPILIEGNAIQIHPLVCTAFNADFDGDQMAVHVPLSEEAQAEARNLMSANKNLLKPGNGDPIVGPRMDMVLGIFWMTKTVDGEKGEGEAFSSPNAAITAYEFGRISFRSKVKVLGTDNPKYKQFEGKVFETSVGRILFNSILPKDFPFINHEVTLKEINTIVEDLILEYGVENIADILDKLKDFGFKYATNSGTTWGIEDLPDIEEEKKVIIDEARTKVETIEGNYEKGLLSEEERYRMVIAAWQDAKNQIEEAIPGKLNKNGSVYDLLTSKARSSISQLSQMSGMKGLIADVKSRTIDFPIIPSYKEGLSPLEYFITTHGARKGLADTALNTARAGYLTRKMVDVAQDIIITADDCGDKDGREYFIPQGSGFTKGISADIDGKIVSKDIKQGNKVLFKKGHLLSKRDADLIEEDAIPSVSVFSPLTCKLTRGVCQKCYGLDLGRNKPVEIGEAVGVIAAQAIGEPGTQLTMRTFHAGGIASAGGDITTGLPRVEEIFERREPKNAAIITTIAGTVAEVKSDGKSKIITILADEGEMKGKKEKSLEFEVPPVRTPVVKKGDHVDRGDLLTDGSAHLQELFKYAGAEKTQDYILREASRLYETQGASISRKHIEVIMRKMLSRKKIKKAGDTRFVAGEVVETEDVEIENARVKEDGGEQAVADTVLLGISEVALSSGSFLSASSFQNTTKVLIDAAVNGKTDNLRGLKENVIIGRLIPAGTGLSQGHFGDIIDEVAPEPEEENEGEDN
ncbi:DNA-directed RNA polymerase subunit beta' [bacterium]|nr:DNA-directed RNA polymerase subunit beta' [bacterium]